MDAGELMVEHDAQKAISALIQAAELHKKSGNGSKAGKAFMKAAEVYE
jgi:hypothetical protein